MFLPVITEMIDTKLDGQVVERALQNAKLQKEDIDWLVLHQANQRILDSAAQRLGVPAERVVSNLAEYGNTSAASIPLALDEAVRSGSIQAGSTVRQIFWEPLPFHCVYSTTRRPLRGKCVLQLAMAGFGAGLTWAAAIVKWQ